VPPTCVLPLQAFDAGNHYINRNTIGAVLGVQARSRVDAICKDLKEINTEEIGKEEMWKD